MTGVDDAGLFVVTVDTFECNVVGELLCPAGKEYITCVDNPGTIVYNISEIFTGTLTPILESMAGVDNVEIVIVGTVMCKDDSLDCNISDPVLSPAVEFIKEADSVVAVVLVVCSLFIEDSFG